MRSWSIFFLAALGTFIIDQGIKELFLEGYQWQSRCLSLELHLNKGVAFSLFSSLGPWLKWIQLLLISAIMLLFLKDGGVAREPFASGLLIGAALGNLYDRFVHSAVIDYIYWHCGFDFAVFNYADVMIDVSIVWLVWNIWRQHRHSGS